MAIQKEHCLHECWAAYRYNSANATGFVSPIHNSFWSNHGVRTSNARGRINQHRCASPVSRVRLSMALEDHRSDTWVKWFGWREFERYDALVISEHYRNHLVPVIWRLFSILGPAGVWILQAPVINFVFKRQLEDEQTRVQAKALVGALTQMGPTFVKIGQLLSNRPDVVKNPIYLDELQTLQDKVAPFPDDQAKQLIEDAYKAPISQVFAYFSETNVAAASLGQVYKAKFKSSDEFIAVKVQRPGVLYTASIDLFILRLFASFMKAQLKLRSDLPGIIDEYGKQLFDELDYIKEAQNCNRFRSLYGDIPGIVVPKAYETTKQVIALDWIDGTYAPWEDGVRMTSIGIQCSLKQLLEKGFFHLDPHSKNLLRTPDGKLAYLDFGMMGELSEQRRYDLLASMIHLVNKDYSLLAEDFVKLDFLPPGTDLNPIVSILQETFTSSSDSGKLQDLNFGKLTKNMAKLARKTPIRLPPYYSLVIRSLTILEGIALKSDPDFRIINEAYPYVTQRLLNDPSKELVDALTEIVIDQSTGKLRWNRLRNLIVDGKMGRVDPMFTKVTSSRAVAALPVAENATRTQSSALVPASNAIGSISTQDSETLVEQVFDFFLSSNGRFLRDALVLEIVDTLDSFQLMTAEEAHRISFGLVPLPMDKPDRERIKLIEEIIRGSIRKTSDDLGSDLGTRSIPRPAGMTPSSLSMNVVKVFFKLVRENQYDSAELSYMLRAITGELAVRNTRRFWRRLLKNQEDGIKAREQSPGTRPKGTSS